MKRVMGSSTIYISYKNSSLHYKKYQGGKKNIFIFHGYGHTHVEMFQLSKFFQQRGYTVYAFDLFFHGNSVWDYKEQPIQLEELKHIFTILLKKERIAHFSLLAYSIGSRFALSISYLFPQYVDAMYLIAPDAVKVSHWYRFLTSTTVGMILFRLVKSKRFYNISVSIMSKLVFINTGILRFVKYRMSTEHERNKIYMTWMAFKKLSIPFVLLSEKLNEHAVSFYMFLGKYDRIIPYDKLMKQMKYLENKEVYLYDMGHNHLIRSTEVLDDLGSIIITKKDKLG